MSGGISPAGICPDTTNKHGHRRDRKKKINYSLNNNKIVANYIIMLCEEKNSNIIWE